MARLQTKTISRRTVEALTVEKDTVFWDRELSGFGVRVYPSGSKVYVVQTRAGGKAATRVTVGRHGVITAEEARRRAALIVARIKAGEDPVPEPMAAKLLEGPTVGELARDWLDEHVAVRCKAKTAYIYRLVVEKHILPGFGKTPALGVSHAQVTELHHGLRERPVTANRAVDVLSRIYNAAEDRGRIPEASNPCRLVAKFRERTRERFLTDGEFRRLGRVLDEAETCKGVSVHAVAAIRLLLLTGCRKSEILNLRWDEVDLGANELRLPDTKTGPRTISLSPEAAAVLAAIPARRGQPACHPGQDRGQADAESERPLEPHLRARGARGRAHPRLQAFVRVKGAGARGELADDRAPARSHAGRDDRALCASGEGFGARFGGADFGEHRRRPCQGLSRRRGRGVMRGGVRAGGAGARPARVACAHGMVCGDRPSLGGACGSRPRAQ